MKLYIFLSILILVLCFSSILMSINEKKIEYYSDNFNFQSKSKIFNNNMQIIVIGDLHGNKNALLRILQNEQLLDTNNNWIPNNNKMIIQVGDVVDRGPESLETLLLLKKIQQQAKKGQVIRLIGNHELLLLQNDLRFINKETDTTEKIDIMKQIIKHDILNNNMLYSFVLGNKLFIHAGLTINFLVKYNLNNKSLNQISYIMNNDMKNIVQNIESMGDAPLISNDGPLWVRNNYNNFPTNIIQIVGHSIKNNIHISPLNNLIYVDVGLTMNNRIGYLEINNDQFLVHEGDYSNISVRKLL